MSSGDGRQPRAHGAGHAGSLPAVLALGGLLLTGCAEATDAEPAGADAGAATTFRDGTYVGRSGADDSGGYGEVRITLRGNDVVAAEYQMRQADGTAKDENYGKRNGEIVNAEFYKKAQAAVAAGPQYAAQLVAVDDPDDVDLVAGATISHRQFAEAAESALDQARA